MQQKSVRYCKLCTSGWIQDHITGFAESLHSHFFNHEYELQSCAGPYRNSLIKDRSILQNKPWSKQKFPVSAILVNTNLELKYGTDDIGFTTVFNSPDRKQCHDLNTAYKGKGYAVGFIQLYTSLEMIGSVLLRFSRFVLYREFVSCTACKL